MDNAEAKQLLEKAGALSDDGKTTEAIALYEQVIKIAPDWSAPYYNLGLLYKYECEWEKSLYYNQRAVELAPDEEAGWWNLGVAATALKKWLLARQSWNFFGLNYELNNDEPTQAIGRCPVRINPEAGAEVVWCNRLDPARAIIESIPLPASGHRFGDMMLNDGAPIGYRVSEGNEYPVFNELQLLQPSGLHTWSVRVKNCKPKHIDKLLKLCDDASVEAEDWSTVRWLCKKCSEGIQHEEHDQELKNDDPAERYIGFASESKKPIEQVLIKWRVLTFRNYSKLILELV